MADFDPNHDYFEELGPSDKYTDKDSGREYPYLSGLIRLAHTHRGGVKEVRSEVVKVPRVDAEFDQDEEGKTIVSKAADCIAAVTVTYYFQDGTVFAGSADASFKAHEAPFNLHLTAVAESKAEARAIRRAFMITKVAKEEIGSPDVAGEPDDGPITDTQIHGIRRIAKRKKLSMSDVLKLIKRTDIDDISDLTAEEGRAAMKAVNKAKAK